ncbi:hypothetical protein BB560_000987 [Smittium megazygosporum]|uniref:GRAM domain-containing protein n=1 Tax=Smittium megazygosporum TaxID=133381 RepID=A0A2T9ZIR5_9FUNG|nr:hypothetical protein BB560_000987 [Smittium megazygosporum]
MALNCVLLKKEDLSPVELPQENFLIHVKRASFSLESGNGYPGTSESYKCSDGAAYLSNKRLLFIDNKQAASLGPDSYGRLDVKLYSFSVPLNFLSEIKYAQPIFGTNYLSATAEPVPQGGIKNEGKLRLYFKEAGGFELYNILIKLKQRIYETGDFTPHEEPLPSYSPAQSRPNNPNPTTNLNLNQTSRDANANDPGLPPPYSPSQKM